MTIIVTFVNYCSLMCEKVKRSQIPHREAKMNPVAWTMVCIGIFPALLWIAAILLDVWFERHGYPTISQRLLRMGFTRPYLAGFVGLVVGLFLGMCLGGMLVHLWMPILSQ